MNLDYDGANKVSARVVQQRGLSHEQLVRVYRVLGVTAAVLDKENASREAFQQLLTYDPTYTCRRPEPGPEGAGAVHGGARAVSFARRPCCRGSR